MRKAVEKVKAEFQEKFRSLTDIANRAKEAAAKAKEKLREFANIGDLIRKVWAKVVGIKGR